MELQKNITKAAGPLQNKKDKENFNFLTDIIQFFANSKLCATGTF